MAPHKWRRSPFMAPAMRTPTISITWLRGPVVHDSHPPLAFGTLGHDSVTGEGNAGQVICGGARDDTLNGTGVVDVIYGGSGNDTIEGNGGDDTIHGGSGSDTINGNDGNDTIIGGYGGDQLTGSNGDDIFVYLSAIDSNSTQFDTIIDFTSGTDKINLAALGALAFLHLTSTSTSVPPHTLAWIYNPTSNETIIYVNPTDRSLDIGDPGLLEIHLQGVVSVAESDFVYEPEAAAVAAALEGIDPALLVATASDGTVLTTGSAHAFIEAEASESTLGTAGVWTMPADDGLRFHFGRDRIGSIVSTRLTSFSDDSAYATEESNDCTLTAPVHVLSIELGNAPGNSAGHGNSQQASNSASTKASAAPELMEPGVTPGHSNSQHPSHSASASATGAAEPAETGNAPGNSAGHGNSQHASNSAAAKAPRPTSRQNRASHPATATRPLHTRRQQALWERPSRSKLPAHPVIARATVTRSTPRTRQLRRRQRPTSRQNRASHPATATRPHHTRRQQALWERPSRSKLPAHPVIARATVTRSTPRTRQLRRRQRPTSRQNRASHPATATRPHHTRRQQALWGRPSRSKLATHPVIARATVTRSTPRTRQLRRHQRPTSRQNRASHPATATRTHHTRRQQALWERPSRSKLPAHPVIARATVTRSTPRIRQLRTRRRPTSRQNRASHPATATRPHHTRRQQALWGRPSPPKLPAHPAIARATVTRSTPRIRQLRTRRRPTSRQNRASHPATATRTQHTRRQQALWGRPSRSRRARYPGNSAGHSNCRLRPPPLRTYQRPPSRLNLRPGQAAPSQEPAFHFKNQGVPSSPIEVVELEQLKDWPVLPGHAGDLPAIPQVGPAAMEEHAASHVNNGQHHAIAHLPHELLI